MTKIIIETTKIYSWWRGRRSVSGVLTFGRDLENLSPNLSPNLSLALSYKEREAEYIFLFGEALNSTPWNWLPPWNKKRSNIWSPPFEGGRKGDLKGGRKGDLKGGREGSDQGIAEF